MEVLLLGYIYSLLFCKLTAGTESCTVFRGATGNTTCPVVPVEAAVIAEAEVHAAVAAAIVHRTREIVVVEHVVIDVNIVPAVSIADADSTIDNLPTELALVVVIIAAVNIVV